MQVRHLILWPLIFLDMETEFLTFHRHGSGFLFSSTRSQIFLPFLNTELDFFTVYRHRAGFLPFIDTETDSYLWSTRSRILISSTQSWILRFFFDMESDSPFIDTESDSSFLLRHEAVFFISMTLSQILYFVRQRAGFSFHWHKARFFISTTQSRILQFLINTVAEFFFF